MNYYVLNDDIKLYEGIKVTKETKLEFRNSKVYQKIENLKLFIRRKNKGNGFKEDSRITIDLQEGDILLFEGENRGYFKPLDNICTVKERIECYEAYALAADSIVDGDKNDFRSNEKEGSKIN